MTKREWSIPANAEYRFEVDFGDTAVVKLLSGTAEVFGAELAPNRDYLFTGQKVAIFSFDSCIISVEWRKEKGNDAAILEYVSSESVAVPAFLQCYKVDIVNSRRVLILGSGRNTLSRTLSNYHVRSFRSPLIWGSVDVRTNSLFFPGSLTANVMREGQVVEPEQVGMVSGMAEESCSPFSLFFGSLSISDNYKLYKRMVERLSAAIEARSATLEKCISIICGPGEQDCESISTLPEDLINLLQIDLVVIVGNERLHARLARQLQTLKSGCRLVKLAKSGGQVSFPRPHQFDQQIRHALFENYFYGAKLSSGGRQLNPFSQTLTLNNDFYLFRWLLGSEDVAPMSALPLGATRKLDETRAVKADLSSSFLLYSIIAVLHPTDSLVCDQTTNAIEFAVSGNVAGFLYVTAVDEQRQSITVLSPCPGQPPSKVFLCGRIKWIE